MKNNHKKYTLNLNYEHKMSFILWEEEVDEDNEKQIVYIYRKKSCHDQFWLAHKK